ncbi:hypothetical protein [Amycolatopsis sp. NPDC059657]|uniref:hypothetical protein n=1 Tax=Amycolatopsis sp. NPDC059657 TaxID=3346899 RepID=UPI00366FC3AB
MGVESANYRYVSDGDKSQELELVFCELGIECISEVKDGMFKNYVFRGEHFWIDIQVNARRQEVDVRSLVSIRVALINPGDVAGKLRELLKYLLGRCGGWVIDMSTRERYSSIDDGSWDRLWREFLTRRRDFIRGHGEFEAAISGADVFQYMRENRRLAES